MASMLASEDEVCPHPACLLTELGDGTGVLLDLETKFYFTLNETGVVVWKRLAEAGSGTSLGLAAVLTEIFDVAETQAIEDVRALVSELLAAGLVRKG